MIHIPNYFSRFWHFLKCMTTFNQSHHYHLILVRKIQASELYQQSSGVAVTTNHLLPFLHQNLISSFFSSSIKKIKLTKTSLTRIIILNVIGINISIQSHAYMTLFSKYIICIRIFRRFWFFFQLPFYSFATTVFSLLLSRCCKYKK